MSRAKCGVLVMALSLAAVKVWGQAPPVLSPATAAEQVEAPVVPAKPAPVTNPFPPVDAKNFTADTPTVETVNAFLKAVWGSNTNRIWSVAGIQKTATPGVSKIIVLIGDKTQAGRNSEYAFFVMPDGKHAIADTMVDFGAKPFAERRKILQDGATGPAEGAKGRELLLVEFGDLLNAKSKEAHEIAGNLAKEFPEARWVYESAPAAGHAYATKAAAYGVCVRKAKGDAAFFAYADAVYSKQDVLTANTADAAFAAAATAAGADEKSVAACADSQAAKDEVAAEVALGSSVGVEQAPVLIVNGHVLPQSAAGYETLKSMVAFQAAQDGITVRLQPTLSTLK